MTTIGKMIPLKTWLEAKGLSRQYHYDHQHHPDYVRTVRQGGRIFVPAEEDARYDARLMAKARRRPGRPRKNPEPPIAAE